MALVISQLWQRGDRSLLIMPGNLPMDSGSLVSEMKKYLEDGWDPVIKSDVDGAHSLPLRIDHGNRHFGRLSAARRSARAVYMGSAPRPDGKRGVDMKSVVLGCTQPGEPPGQFADALRRLSSEATHLYVDGAQYWYSLIPNVTRIAADRAASNYTDRDADDETRHRIRAQSDRGAFAAVQVFTAGPGDVPDDDSGVRLVILEPGATHSPNDANSPAISLAERILGQREAGPRLNRNLLVFLAAAANRLVELRGAARLYLAWESILHDREAMNLTVHQQSQAKSKRDETSKQVDSLIAEAFTHILNPQQQPGTSEIEWQDIRVTVPGHLAKQVGGRLDSEEMLIGAYSGMRIRLDLDRRNLWSERGDIPVNTLWETYARFPHMPRLANRNVLHKAIAARDASLTWLKDTFAYAEDYDGEHWVGLQTDKATPPAVGGLLVHPDRIPAAPGSPAESEPGGGIGESGPYAGSHDESRPYAGSPHAQSSKAGRSPVSHDGHSTQQVSAALSESEIARPTQFYARFNLDQVRCIKQLADIADNVSGKLGTDVEFVLEIRAANPTGFGDATQRTVLENARNLGARSAEFE